MTLGEPPFRLYWGDGMLNHKQANVARYLLPQIWYRNQPNYVWYVVPMQKLSVIQFMSRVVFVVKLTCACVACALFRLALLRDAAYKTVNGRHGSWCTPAAIWYSITPLSAIDGQTSHDTAVRHVVWCA